MEGKLIEAGICNLKEFGYPAVTANNILTDMIYSQVFKRMLEETKSEANPCFAQGAAIIASCDLLLAKIAKGEA